MKRNSHKTNMVYTAYPSEHSQVQLQFLRRLHLTRGFYKYNIYWRKWAERLFQMFFQRFQSTVAVGVAQHGRFRLVEVIKNYWFNQFLKRVSARHIGITSSPSVTMEEIN